MARLPSKSDGLRPRRAECRRQSWSEPEGGEDESRWKPGGQRGRIPSSSAFCWLQAFSSLHEGRPGWRGQPALPGPPTRRLMSSGNALPGPHG